MFTEFKGDLDSFDSAIAGKDVLLKFHASWCGPCRAIEPILQDLQKQTNVEILSIDIDQNNDICAKMGVYSVPTVIAMKSGEPVGVVVGAQKKQAFVELIEKLKLPSVAKSE